MNKRYSVDIVENGYVIYDNNKLLKSYEVEELLNSKKVNNHILTLCKILLKADTEESDSHYHKLFDCIDRKALTNLADTVKGA